MEVANDRLFAERLLAEKRLFESLERDRVVKVFEEDGTFARRHAAELEKKEALEDSRTRPGYWQTKKL